jgi:pentatricopeptide repeat protein
MQTLLLWTPNHSCCTFRDADTSNGCSTTHDLPVLIFASVQDREFRSEWHQEREEASSHFRRVIEFGPHDTRKVVAAFGKIEKPKRGDYALLVNYYGKKGDKHSARSVFERMRATGIDPNVHVYTNLVHAYAMAQDMRGATACVEEMEAEGVAPNPATHSVLISGFAKLGNAEAAEHWFQRAKNKGWAPNAVLYHNIINAYWYGFTKFV